MNSSTTWPAVKKWLLSTDSLLPQNGEFSAAAVGVEFKKATRKINWRDAILVPVLVIGLIWLSFAPFAQPRRVMTVNDESVIALTNLERLKHGLAPLVSDETLEEAALAKAQDMIKRDYFAHFYGETTPWQFIVAAGDNSWSYAGENLAKNYQDSAKLVSAWMDSPGHRKNILDDHFSRIGVAVARAVMPNGVEVWVTVQMFTDV